ncbi:MAG: DnaJ domain-containing protein [Myxococcota bacterium]
MSEFQESLSAGQLGAEVLARIARERVTGVLKWTAGGARRTIVFKAGRPEIVADTQDRESSSQQHVVKVVRELAIATSGRCTFEPGNRTIAASLGVDTLGETLVALARGLSEETLREIWRARQGQVVHAAGTFKTLAAAVVQVGGAEIAPPEAGAVIEAIVGGAPLEVQRSWAVLLSLGGAMTRPPSGVSFKDPIAAARSPKSRPPTPVEEVKKLEKASLTFPADRKAKRVAIEIEKAHRELEGKTHYDALGLLPDASAEAIRDAYFEVARRWHSDRFAGLGLDKEWLSKAEAIFSAAAEAQQVLGDAKERKSYDFILDRKAKGLPTDVNIILEADGLFRRAQGMVRRGQAAGAEPLLRQAVEMNKGEAEFWVYFGFAVYSAKGKEGLEEARQAISKGLEMNEKLDCAHEFLGRIAHVEGMIQDAKRELNKAINLNPKNVEAQRELRLLNMRGGKSKYGGEDRKSGLGGLLGGLLKKK